MPNITVNDWQVAEGLVHILEPFLEFTKKLNAKTASLSIVLPNILALDHF